jgi:hypothetical protein
MAEYHLVESNLTFDSMHVILGRPKMLNPSSSWDFLLWAVQSWHPALAAHSVAANFPSADIDSGAAVLTTRHCCLIAFSIIVFLRHNSSGV